MVSPQIKERNNESKTIYIKTFIFSLVTILSISNLLAESRGISVSNPEVFKRNKASCKRLGNIYDACQWMLRFNIKNNSDKKLMHSVLI